MKYDPIEIQWDDEVKLKDPKAGRVTSDMFTQFLKKKYMLNPGIFKKR